MNGGDPDADLFAEMMTAPGPGAAFGPQVRGFDYDMKAVTTISRLDFYAFASPTYGAETAVADVEPDSFGEILCAPGPSPTFRAVLRGFDFDGRAIAPLAGFDIVGFAGTLFGGRVAGADANIDGRAELVAAPGPDPGASAEIQSWVWTGHSLTRMGAPIEGSLGGGMEPTCPPGIAGSRRQTREPEGSSL